MTDRCGMIRMFFPRHACLVSVLIAGTLSACVQGTGSRAEMMRENTTLPNAVSRRAEPDRVALASFEIEIQELQGLLRIPGMSVAVVRDQQLLLAKGYGWADVEGKGAATKDTPYAVASVTKPIAAAMLLQLVERGVVDLDDPARNYSTGFSDDAVRIRHLLTHTSEGIPGEKYAYNGDRFRALTDVIEKASGSPFPQVLAREVLDRLSMSRSVPGHDVLDGREKSPAAAHADTRSRYDETLADFAKPYLVASGRAQRTEYPPRGVNAAAGLISTVVDLAKFDVALDRHLLLKKTSLDKAWTPATSPLGHTLPYGLGWFVQRHQGSKLVWHYGYWQQFSALYLKVPEKNLTLIVLANSNGLSAPFGLGDGDVLSSPFACGFLRAFASEEQIGQRPALSWRPRQSAALTPLHGLRSADDHGMCERAAAALADWSVKDDRREIGVEPSAYENYVGEYELRRAGFFDTRIIITKDQSKLIGSFSGELTGSQNRFELTPASANRFFWKGEAVTFEFDRGADGKASHLIWREFGQSRRLPRVR